MHHVISRCLFQLQHKPSIDSSILSQICFVTALIRIWPHERLIPEKLVPGQNSCVRSWEGVGYTLKEGFHVNYFRGVALN